MSVSTPLTLFLTQVLGPPPAGVGAWWASAQRLELQRGQPLLREGERWQYLWWVERGALRLFYLDREGAESNKNFFLDHAMLWPVTPTLRQTPVMFHVEPMEDSTVWALPIPADGAPPVAHWPEWSQLEHRTLCALLDGKMQREQEFLQLSARQRYALVSVAYLLGIVFFTQQVNLPLNSTTEAWDPQALPAEWADVRDQWNAANLWRTLLSLATFAAALATLVWRCAGPSASLAPAATR